MASCHFLALDISSPCLVKLGRMILLILAKILNIVVFIQRYKKDGLDE